MPPFHSIHIAAPARVTKVGGEVFLLGALPKHRKPLEPGTRIENDRIEVAPGGHVVLEVEGGEQLVLDTPGGDTRVYFLHVIDPERIRQNVNMS